jgi:hypothetical protein
MVPDKNRNAFDNLVAGLSAQDRAEMLQRLNSTGSNTINLVDIDDEIPEKAGSIHLKYQALPFFHKFILWIRSMLQGKSPERVYNDDALADLAKKINRIHPGLVDHRIKSLDSLFFQQLKSLKDASDFFKPYFLPIDESSGEFYVFLSSFIAPGISEKINSEADPFSFSFDEEPSKEHKAEILKSLDDVLNNLDSTQKANLYDAIVSLNWLKRFSVLPFLHFMAQFTSVVGDTYTCPYRNATVDYDIFAPIFTNLKSINAEVLEALFLFTHKKEFSENPKSIDLERSVKEFMANATSNLSAVQMFISSVPVNKLGRIINENFDWQPGNMPGVEGWFPKFRAQWRSIIEIRWVEWTKERKKNSIASSLHADFNLSYFPEMEYHPWTSLWSKINFNYELCGGFLSWFSAKMYPEYLVYLNDIMIEGIFNGSDKRALYTDAFNLFKTANQNMSDLIERLSPAGDLGVKFSEWSKYPSGSIQMQNQISTTMGKIDSEVAQVIRDFKNSAAALCKFLAKLFSSEPKRSAELLQNFTMIKGRENQAWRDGLENMQKGLSKTVYYLSEFEPIDLRL